MPHWRAIGIAVSALAVLLACALPAAAFESPNEPSSEALVEQPERWDGKTVEFKGEAIGEAMVRGDDAWLHLNDDAYLHRNVEEGAVLDGYNTGMPVWVPAELARGVRTFGDHKHEGDIVEVVGVFNAACGEHGGDMDIHARRLTVLVPGRVVADPVSQWKLDLAFVLTAGAASAVVVERHVRHRERVGKARLRR